MGELLGSLYTSLFSIRRLLWPWPCRLSMGTDVTIWYKPVYRYRVMAHWYFTCSCSHLLLCHWPPKDEQLVGMAHLYRHKCNHQLYRWLGMDTLWSLCRQDAAIGCKDKSNGRYEYHILWLRVLWSYQCFTIHFFILCNIYDYKMVEQKC